MKQIILLPILFTILSATAQTATSEQVANKEVKGLVNTYISQSGFKVSVGDEITLGNAFRGDVYDYINTKSIIGAEDLPLKNVASGSKVKILKMKIYYRAVHVTTSKPQGSIFRLIIHNFEQALQNGEVKSNILSSDEALEELSKAKKKLDLGLITQEAYDKKKERLKKFIK